MSEAADTPGRRPLRVYGNPGCWKCVEIEEHLDRLGVPYESIAVRGNPEARDAMVRLMGEPPRVPLIVDGAVAVWDRRRIARYLDEAYGGGAEGSFRDLPSFMGGYCEVDGDCAPRAPEG